MRALLALSVSWLACGAELQRDQATSLSLLQINAQSIPSKSKDDAPVCVSLPAYEKSEWIDALVANVNKFTNAQTKVAIHLDLKSTYDEKDMMRWNSDKISVNPERIIVQVFHGGILYAHLLNSRHLEQKWPGYCAYFVMAASNMFWVREGMELAVRKAQMTPFVNITCDFNDFICQHGYMLDITNGDIHSAAWAQPEGFFLPMKLVHEFDQHLGQWISQAKANVTESVILMNGHFEEFWIQTYLRNKAQNIPASTKGTPPLCLRKLGDGVNLQEVQDVMNEGKPDEGRYAVKRVERNFTNEVTKYVVALSK